MKIRNLVLAIFVSLVSLPVIAQDEAKAKKEEKIGGFKKENLFTGGGVTASFSNYITTLGASPVFGYSITKWLDAGIVINFLYSSNRHALYYEPSGGSYYYSDDKLRQTIYGPGAFLKIYPVNFIFLQAQGEINFIRQKLIYDNGSPSDKTTYSAPSLLVGGGYCNGRENNGEMFYYVSLLFDIAKDDNSPYVEQVQSGSVNVLPIVRAGVQIPLFQGGGSRRGGN
jgi:hypothetical protein